MALSDRITEPTDAPQHGKPCSIGLVYQQVAGDAAELAALNTLMYEQGKTRGQVYSDLTEEGFTVGDQSINRHRGGTCRCFKLPPFRFCKTCKRDNASCVCGRAA